MNDFLEKWKDDSKYRAKIKLIIYVAFVSLITLYALTLNANMTYTNEEQKKEVTTDQNENKIMTDIITLSKECTYTTTITIDENIYEYVTTKELENETIMKIDDDEITRYIVKNKEYYKEEEDSYIKTTKNDVYDKVNYNYVNIDNINLYLTKATKNNQEYMVYLKDVILGDDSGEYFIIRINKNHINIDYTPLVRKNNHDIQKYQVDIKIEDRMKEVEE